MRRKVDAEDMNSSTRFAEACAAMASNVACIKSEMWADNETDASTEGAVELVMPTVVRACKNCIA